MNEQKSGSGMAVASLVLGILGMLLACVVIGIIPAVISLILSIIVLSTGKPGKGLAIAGLVTSAIGLLIFIAIVVGVAGSEDAKEGFADGYSAAIEETTTAKGTEMETNQKETEVESTTQAESEEKTEFTVGDTVEVDKGLKITILSAGEYTSDNQFIQPEDGKMYYKIDLEMENTSDKDTSVSSFLGFEAYEDGYSISQTFVAGIDSGLDGDLAAGKKIKGSLAYEVSKDFKELELQYKPNVWLDKKIIMKFTNQ